MNTTSNYTTPTLVKGKKPMRIPKGSTLEKEWAKNTWYVNYTYNGKQHRIKGNINRIKDPKEKAYQGEVLLQSIKDDLKNGFNPQNPDAFIAKVTQENILLNDAIDQYLSELKTYARSKTVQSYQSKLRYFAEAFPNKLVKSFTSTEIERYIYSKIHSSTPARLFMNDRSIELSKAIQWTPNTVRSAKGIFRAFFQWCIANKYFIGDNPASKMEAKRIRSEIASKPRHTPFSKEDITMLMEYLDTTDKPIAFFARFIYSTCLRPGEISKLKLSDFDPIKNQIIIPLKVTKNTKKIEVERIDIEPNFQTELKKLELEKYPKQYFFTGDTDTIIAEKSIGSNTAYKRFVKALKALGMEGKGYTLYSFKHFSNLQRLNNGWTLTEIMKANRHSSISMTERYLKDINRQTDISTKEIPSI